MRTRTFVHHLLSLLISASLLLTPAASTAQAAVPQAVSLRPEQTAAPQTNSLRYNDFALYRTHIVIDSPNRRARLDQLGVVVLEEGEDWAVVLADDEQLESLARLRYEPRASDEFVSLVDAHAGASPWLASGLAPLTAQAAALSAITPLPAGEGPGVRAAAARKSLRASAHALTPEQRTALADLTSLDDDADGLTNAQESWWCTDPLNADTDGDGRTDGAEIQVLRDWLGNRRAGPPNETPWPDWPPQRPGCEDKDHDSIPNLAERWDLGLSMDLESTDRDRYDDGQELFGTTYCPGGGNACGYGTLPSANHDGILLFPQMPSWVTGAGKHPLVAAYPRLDFSIVKDSDGSTFKMRTATVVTTDERHEEGETKSYSTTKTEGTSTSDAETETWENWQEYSKTTEAQSRMPNGNGRYLDNTFINSTEQRLQVTNVRMNSVTNNSMRVNVTNKSKVTNNYGGGSSLAGELSAPVTSYVIDEACAEFSCRKYIGSGIRASVRTFADVVQGTLLGTSDKIQDEFKLNKCDPTSLNLGQVWCRIKSAGTLWKKNYDERLDAATIAEQEARGLTAGNYLQTDPSGLNLSRVYPISFPEPRFTPTETNTTGSSTGGARTTTHTTYSENAVTEGTAKQFGRSWGEATAVNSTHAADLWFAYAISNIGTDYARVICDLAINIYIGDSVLPAATYYPGNDLGGDGCFSNFQPGETHRYSFPSQSRITLTLEQMAAIDQGEAVRFVIEDYSLGQDDFYADDAIGANIQISIEDGTDDGNEAIDSYLLPTWGEESVVDALARYFPHTLDENGTVIAIWTPEYRSDTPAWCADPKVVGIGGQRTLWCKHALSTADWWNVYTNGLGDGSEGFQDTPASPGAVALFRFNKDTDLDGYSDRSEARLGTDPNDPGDFPRPELLAGLHSIRSGDSVTATLSLLNTGLYDAYGVEAVLIAPDDSVSITNNTVGGSGRVRAQKQVIVGSRIALQTPLPSAWTQAGHAVPAAGGYYTGGEDRTYTFTVQCGNAGGCSVGSEQLSIAWSDGTGNSGTLDFGDGYASPTFLPVGAHGLTLALHSGTVANGESFTMDARTPRDTFQYTINREPYTEPLVIVSYNDPQGNHRFILPPAAASLTTPSDNLAAFAGQMLDDVGVEIVTTEEYSGGATSTRLLVNNPSETQLTGANVFLEFINISGTVVSEVTTQVNLPPGPTTAEVAWDAAAFNPAYSADEDYIVMAFLTDHEGNILDTAGRPLSSFQDDPRPAAALDNGAQVWDFGAAQQGTLIEHPFALASVGYLDLLAYLGNAPGLSVDGPAATSISPGDVALYTVQLNTESLSVGAYEATIPVRTSDPQNPAASLTIRGTITPGPDVIWRTKASMPTPRVGHTITSISDGTVLSVGGTDGATLVDSVEVYNPLTDSWSTRTSLPSARERLGSATLSDGKLYVIGGCGSFTCATAYQTVEAYDPSTNTWTTRANMPTARGNFGIAATASGKIYVIGGSAGGGWNATVEEYDSVANSWQSRANLLIPRYGLAAATGQNGKIYAFGGFNENGPIDTVEEYDPAANSWRLRSSMPTARGYLSAVTGDNGLIYVLGGSNGAGTEYTIAEVYDPSADTWTQATSMPTARYGAGATLAANGHLYVVGGWNSSSSPAIIGVTEEATLPPAPNLQLARQVNSVSDSRPLDWPLHVAGNYSQGAQYDFAHSLGPDPATLHPCTVYDQSGKVLKGVGKYCTELGQGTASYEMFGDGRDGVMPGSGNLDNANGFAAGSVNGTAGATSISVTDRYAIARINPGDVVLIHQTRGSGAGQWELNKAAADFTGSGTFALQKPLKYSYVSNGGNEKSQILRVPQYSTCNVTGTVTPLASWNGDWGGIFAVMCNSPLSISGNINASGYGFQGGKGGDEPLQDTGQTGESYPGPRLNGPMASSDCGGCVSPAGPANGGGGRGGRGSRGTDGASGGGGGSFGTSGIAGAQEPVSPYVNGGLPGSVYGTSTLSEIYFGSGGGGGGKGKDGYGSDGGNGGGIVALYARQLDVVGSISAAGSTAPRNGIGNAGGGGGGSGGTIVLVAGTSTVGNSRITANGGGGSSGGGNEGSGGSGGAGRIRISSCDTSVGTTNPVAYPQQIDCFVTEQLPTTPYTATRLYLPDAVNGTQSYLVQYARRFVFAASGQQTSTLRLARRVYGGASLDLLVSNAGAASGALALCLDIGNDGVCDYTHSGSTNFPATLEATGLAEALNNYLLGQTDIAWGDPVEVPVRLTLDRQADVMLTNLALTPLGAKTRFVRLEARTYSTATLSLEFRQPGVPSGPLAFTVDVGADGSVDWSYAGTPSFPARLTSPNLAAALNNYLSPFQGGGGGGSVDVPIRIVPSPFLDLSLTDFDADPADRPDLVPQAPTAGGARNGNPIVEGDTVPLTAVIENNGTADSGPLVVTFYAIRHPSTGSGQATQTFYIGAEFVANVPKDDSRPAEIDWNTLGFPGDTTVRAVVDPFNRTRESDESNNSAEALIPIRTRPDLHVTAIELSNPLLMAGETVTVTLTLSNSGQTAAGSQTVELYNANPDSGGAVVETQNLASLPGESATTIQFQWTPTTPGPYRLFSLSDKDGAVSESDEGNNRSWQDVYVGLAAPVLLDSGPNEPVYSPSIGYGVVDEGQPDVTSAPCGSGATVEETQRLDFDGRVVYRFDHLLPGRYYHLDVTLYECTGAGRQQSIYIDGNLVDGPVNLGDGEVHHRSILIDPALYADHSVEVSIESPGVNGAIVSAVNLHAVDYRYADSGGVNDPDYSAGLGYGALNGVKNSAWGRLPYQNVRVNQTGRSVDYRYDNLVADKFYQLHLSFFQTNDTSRVQQVEIDGKLAGAEIALVNNEKQRITLPVPTGTYTDDGSISVSVVRVNANVGAIVNEIALEEVTVPTAVCGVASTPYWTYAYGSVTIEGAPALPGTVVTAENENGDIVGCYRVEQSGFYSFMPIFGSLAPTPGMAEGEQVKFRVNGQLALTEPTLNWTNDKDIHQIDLTISGIESQWIRLNPGWTLFSLRVEPPVTSVTDVLKPVEDIYCDVHGERDVYDCDLPPQAQALTELHGGRAYYIRNNSSATANLFVQGAPIAPTTPISLHTDWNWVGYLLSESTPVGDALASIAGKYSRVADGKARLYKPDQPQFSTLTQLVPDDGYLIFMTEAATLVYPSPLVAAGTEPAAVREVCGDVSPTPAFTWIYGGLLVNGQPAAVGSRVDVLTPRGELAGCFTVDSVGLYGFLPVYGADNGNPPLPGFADGEPMTLRVNGQVVELAEPLLWRDDKQERQADLSATIELQRFFLPLIGASAQAEGAGADTQTPVYLPILGR